MSMFTTRFWIDATERAVSTAAQSAILVIGADQFNVLDADFALVAGFAAGGAVLSLLKALASTARSAENASLVDLDE